MYRITQFILMSSIALAQFDWEENGIAVRQGNHIEWLRTGDVGNQEEMIFAWSDTRDGGRDVFAKKIDITGQELWGDGNGILIVSAPGRQEDPILISDGVGGAYVMWKDYRSEPDDGDFYAQYVLSDGTLAWDAQGIPLTTVPGPQGAPNMSSDGAGGAFAIWSDDTAGTGASSHLYGTHLSPDGVVNPGIGVPLITSNYGFSGVSIEMAAPGSAIMVWTDDRNFTPFCEDNTWSETCNLNTNQCCLDENNDEVPGCEINCITYKTDIYTQRIDSNCNTLWSTPEQGGIPVYSDYYTQAHAKVTYYSDETSVIVWDDNRNDNPDQGGASTEDIYAQFIDMDGNLLFNSSGIAVSTANDRQYKPRIKGSSQGVFVIWSDTRFSTDDLNDIFAQKLTLESGLVWDEAVAVCSEQSGDQTQARLTSDGSGGTFVTWMDDRNEANFDDIFIQHINSSGDISYDIDGIGLAVSDGLQINPLVRTDGSDGAFVVWGDYRTGSLSIYGQQIDISGNFSLNQNGTKYASGLGGNTYTEYAYRPSSLYLGNNQTLLYWVDQRYGVFGQYIFGQKIFSGWNEEYNDYDLLEYIENYGTKLTDVGTADYPIAKKNGNNIILGFSDLEFSEGDGESGATPNYQILDDALDLQYSDLITESPIMTNSIKLLETQDNGIYYVFSEFDPFTFVANIFVQKINEAGNQSFGTPIVVVEDGTQDNVPRGVSEIPNIGFVITYDSESWQGYSVNYIGLDYDGNVLDDWGSTGDLSDYNSAKQYRGMVRSNDGFFVIWSDNRSGSSDIYGQKINFDGTLAGSLDGIPIATSNGDQTKPSISYNETLNEIMVCWEDYSSGIHYDIYCRGINNENLSLAEEIPVAVLSYNHRFPDVHSTLDGSYLVAWQDSRNDPGENLAPDDDIYIQLLSNGQNVFQTNGIVVCDEDFSQTYPQIDLYDENNNSYLIYWNDSRSSGKEDLINVYAQSITVVPSECLLGDVTGDGQLNVLDIVNLVNYIFGVGDFTNEQLCSADLNGDEIINVLDIVNLVNAILSF